MDFLDKLYEVITQDADKITIKLADKNHPIFKAHFPDYPILPGFLLIEIVAFLQQHKIKKIHMAKFISHALPNDILVYNIVKNGFKTKISIVKNDTKVAQIQYE
jgi:3-hydroxyacyl-[acyl-carrier-protein] dehydratase